MKWILLLLFFWIISVVLNGGLKSKKIPQKTKSNNDLKDWETDLDIQIANNQRLLADKLRQMEKKNNTCSEIEKIFNEYGVLSVWHMTHKNNVEDILLSGILSNKSAYEIKAPTDISDHGVQRWRESVDPFYGRKLHEYVPTYFNIKNPMLYVKRNIKNELCLLEISTSAFVGHDFIFTDGNAASRDTRFYNKASDLDKLPWDVLKASYWDSFPDGKRKRCSEVLIYPRIDPRHIIKLHCYSSETWQYLSRFHVSVRISESLFF